MSARYQEGEVLDLHIRGARVVDVHATQPDDAVVVHVGGQTFAVDLTVAAPVQVQRVAPAEWPPQAGDVWLTYRWTPTFNGEPEEQLMRVLYFARSEHDPDGEHPPVVHMYAEDGEQGCCLTPGEVLERASGAPELAYRLGWTRAPEPATATPTRTPQAPPSRSARVRPDRDNIVAGLREMADFIETHPEVPAPPHGLHIHYFVPEIDDASAVALVGTAAAALDVEVRESLHEASGKLHWTATGQFGGVTLEVAHIEKVPSMPSAGAAGDADSADQEPAAEGGDGDE